MREEFKRRIAESIVIEGVTTEEILSLITSPPDRKMGDYSLPCFRFAKALKKSPVVIAETLAKETVLPEGTEAYAINGYVNFRVNRQEEAKRVLEEILENGEKYGDSAYGNGKTICIDYSSINIAKPFHIGHLLTTVLGGSLYKIYEKLGYKCVGINHLGDWGTQFGKLISAFKRWCSKEILAERGMSALTEIYVKFHEEAEKDPSLDDEARAYFKKIEEGDPEAMELFTLFKEVTLKEVMKTYERLHITFDSYNGEAFYNDKMDVVIDELRAKGLLKESDGAQVVDLSAMNMPPCLILKADGATLYATRDLAAAYYRKKTYDFHKCLYVVAYQQNLHFKQVFATLKLLGKEWADDMVHVAFGMVSLEDGAMSTRKGKVVLLEDVLDRAVEKSLEIISEKSPNLENKEQVAEQIGVGAVIFAALYNNRIKDMVFSYDRILNFDGETGPYVQYTSARCKSVIAKVGKIDYNNADYDGLKSEEAEAVVEVLSRFPETLFYAAEKYEPCYVARYLVELCREYNRFYLNNRIANEAEGTKTVRTMLTIAVNAVIEEGLRLLGVSAPDKM